MTTYGSDLGILVKHDFVFAREVAELLLGDVDSSFRDEVDLALLEERVKRVALCPESSSFDFTLQRERFESVLVSSRGRRKRERDRNETDRVVEEIDAEELSFSFRIRPVSNIGFDGDSSLDRPPVHYVSAQSSFDCGGGD